jgi:hypothetical protein
MAKRGKTPGYETQLLSTTARFTLHALSYKQDLLVTWHICMGSL